MCGRFSLFPPPWVIEDRFDATFDYPYERRYNAAPGQALPVIADERPGRIQADTWGLVPTWAEDRSTRSVNARAETVAEKPNFRGAFAGTESGSDRRDETAAGRCLVLADGYYEWSDAGQPYRVARADGEPFAMAGLWTRWRPPTTQTGLGSFAADGPQAEPALQQTFAIVTTEANDVVGAFHDRMPVVLPADGEGRWLTGDDADAAALLDPAPDEVLRADAVSRAVNDPANDAPAVLAEIDAPG